MSAGTTKFQPALSTKKYGTDLYLTRELQCQSRSWVASRSNCPASPHAKRQHFDRERAARSVRVFICF